MAGPLYPDVPATDGVPPVNRGPDNPADSGSSQQLSSDSPSIAQQAGTQWGVYTQGGALALNPDNITALSYDAEYRQADYPIEQGGFETYDKVQMPFDTTVEMSKGGALADRIAFTQAIEAIRGDTNIYNIVSPEATYMNVNIGRVSIDRSVDRGAGKIIASIHFREIRQSATKAFSSSKAPASATAANNGPAQATTAPATTAQSVPAGPLNPDGTVYF